MLASLAAPLFFLAPGGAVPEWSVPAQTSRTAAVEGALARAAALGVSAASAFLASDSGDTITVAVPVLGPSAAPLLDAIRQEPRATLA